ncbi:MAG: T9SS type A sorting domain-containing protein [Saprospiraceae bacterium]|nr:T9SS type A sorting domain-containing protein [Saprospiraceae bacterium]
MKKHLQTAFIALFFATTAMAQHTNIVIDNTSGADEPSICLDYRNPNRIVAGSNTDNIYYSSDAGRTWTRKKQQSSFGVYGDPVIVCDTAGAFYHFHLSNPPTGSWIDRIVGQKSTDGGKTWNDGAFMGKDGTKNQDKHWVSVDHRNNALYCTWTQFDKYESRAPQDSTHILFSKSTDGGVSWSTAKRIDAQGGDCLDDDNTVEGAVPCVGANGEVYVAWASPTGLVFNRSLDGGATWLPRERKIADIGGGWSYEISGIYRANGLPFTVCDTSQGTRRGTIYVNWSDQKNGANNTDVWLTKSTDGGATWSPQKRVNDDNSGKQQFFTSMTLDQKTGWLWFVFYDRRNYADDSTDVYMAYSKDGGETFKNFKVSEQAFSPRSTTFFGDYTHVTAHNNIVRPIWTAMDARGSKTIYTALVNVGVLTSNTEGGVGSKNIGAINAFPNPTTHQLTVNFETIGAQKLSLKICDATGKTILTAFEKRKFVSGQNTEVVNVSNISSGVYMYLLQNKRGKTVASGRFILAH